MRCGSGLQEESVKLLGVHIDEDLNWKIHIKYINKKLVRVITSSGDTEKIKH
jgi:hypothetical protein